jgi:hypothetical protein
MNRLLARVRKIIAKLRNKYRLVLLNDSSFAEVLSIQLTPLNLLMLLSSFFVIFTIIIFLLIAFTPMRHLVPGYGKANDTEAWMEMNQRIEDMSREVKDRQMKIDALNNILSEKEKVYDSSSVRKEKIKQ